MCSFDHKTFNRKLLRKNCEFKDIKQEDLLISKIITSITDKKLRQKLIREIPLNFKTTMDLVTQDSYEKRNKQSTIPTALVKAKEIKQEPNKNYTKTTNQTKTHTPKDQHNRKMIADSAGNKTGHHYIKAQQRR